MIESPLLDELANEAKAQGIQDAIAYVLKERFGITPPELVTALRGIQEETRLQQLVLWAGQCPDLAAFQARLIGGV